MTADHSPARFGITERAGRTIADVSRSAAEVGRRAGENLNAAREAAAPCRLQSDTTHLSEVVQDLTLRVGGRSPAGPRR